MEEQSSNQPPKRASSPWRIYRELKRPEYKVQFWTVTISIFVIIFTLWMGLTYVFVGINANKGETERAEHIRITDKLLSYKNKYGSFCDSLLVEYLSTDDSNKSLFRQNNTMRICDVADSCNTVILGARYYLEKDSCDVIEANCQRVYLLVMALRELAVPTDSIIDFAYQKIKFVKQYNLQKESDFQEDVENLLGNIQKLKKRESFILDLCRLASANEMVSFFNDVADSIIHEDRNYELEILHLKDSIQQSGNAITPNDIKLLINIQDKALYEELSNPLTEKILNLVTSNYIIISSSIIPKYEKTALFSWDMIPNSSFLVFLSLITFTMTGVFIWFLVSRLLLKKESLCKGGYTPSAFIGEKADSNTQLADVENLVFERKEYLKKLMDN